MSKRKYMLKPGVDEVLGAHVHLQRHDNGVSPRVELDPGVASLYPGLVPVGDAGAETGSDATTEDTTDTEEE